MINIYILNNTTLVFEEWNAGTKALGQSEVDKSTCCVMLDDSRKARSMIRVVPLIGREDQLRQSVRNSGRQQIRMVGGVQRQ